MKVAAIQNIYSLYIVFNNNDPTEFIIQIIKLCYNYTNRRPENVNVNIVCGVAIQTNFKCEMYPSYLKCKLRLIEICACCVESNYIVHNGSLCKW